MQNIFILTTLIATSAAWVIPTYVVRQTSATAYTDVYSEISSTSTYIDKFTLTNVLKLSITAAPADATPIATVTSTDYNHLTIEYIELAAADLPTPLPTAPGFVYEDTNTEHIYIQRETYSNPASCSDVEPWSYSTRVTVSVPTAATYQLKPTSESTMITKYDSGYGGASAKTKTYVYHFLAPGSVPTSTSSFDSYYGSYETDACEMPFEARYNFDDDDDDAYDYSDTTDSTSSSSDRSYRGSMYDRPRLYGKFETYLLAIIIAIPTIFVLGFVESYFWFTKLMKGRSALRGGTVMWVLISLWAACLIRSENAGADKEWRETAEAKWKSRGLGEKLKLWLKYGFRWSYPVAVMGERSLPPKYVPAAAAAVAATTVPAKTVETASMETAETAGAGEGRRDVDVPGTPAPPAYVDASRNPV